MVARSILAFKVAFAKAELEKFTATIIEKFDHRSIDRQGWRAAAISVDKDSKAATETPTTDANDSAAEDDVHEIETINFSAEDKAHEIDQTTSERARSSNLGFEASTAESEVEELPANLAKERAAHTAEMAAATSGGKGLRAATEI